MKITKSQIKKIIQEEIQGLLSEKALPIVKGIPKPRDIYRSTRDYENAVRYLTVLGLGSDHPSFDHPHRNLDDLDDMERRYTYDPPEKPKMRYAKIRNFDLGGDKGLDDASVQDMVAQLVQQTLDRSPNMQRQIASPVSPTSRPHGERLEEISSFLNENMQIDSRLPAAPAPKKQAPLNRDFEKIFGTEDPLAGLVDPESPIPKELFDRVRAMSSRFKTRGKAAESRPVVNPARTLKGPVKEPAGTGTSNSAQSAGAASKRLSDLEENEKLKLDPLPGKMPKVSYGTVGGGLRSVLRQVVNRIIRSRVGAEEALDAADDAQLIANLNTLAVAGQQGARMGKEGEKLKLAKLRKTHGRFLPKIARDVEAKKATGRDQSAKEMAGSLVGKTLTEVEPIPRRQVPAVNMLPFELEKNASETRSEEQVNETGETPFKKKQQAAEKSRNLRPNTPEDEERRKNDAAYEKGLKRIKRAVDKKNRRFARQPAKK